MLLGEENEWVDVFMRSDFGNLKEISDKTWRDFGQEEEYDRSFDGLDLDDFGDG